MTNKETENVEELFPDFDEDYEQGETMGSMFNVLQGSQNTALALTHLIVNKCDIKGLSEDKVFAIFNRASDEVTKTFADTMNSIAPTQEE
jgi:hypothetical protein